MLEAKQEHTSSGIMDYRYDDYSLNRYVTVRILSKEQATVWSNKRLSSGWTINNLEKKMYGNIHKLAAAFIPLEDITPVEEYIDLSQKKDPASVEVTIIKK